MTHQEFDLSAFTNRVHERPDLDLVREMVTFLYQALIDQEATDHIGAEPHERSLTRTTRRNGSRPRKVSSKAGDLSLKIPKIRKGSFFPSILERRRRIDEALYAVVIGPQVHGVSTRKVDDLVQALGVDAGISKSEVSRICAAMDEELEAFRTRSLSDTTYPYVFLDATNAQGPGEQPSGLPGRRRRHGGDQGGEPRDPRALHRRLKRTRSSGPSSSRASGLGGSPASSSSFLTRTWGSRRQSARSWLDRPGSAAEFTCIAQRACQGPKGPRSDGLGDDQDDLRSARPGVGPRAARTGRRPARWSPRCRLRNAA